MDGHGHGEDTPWVDMAMERNWRLKEVVPVPVLHPCVLPGPPWGEEIRMGGHQQLGRGRGWSSGLPKGGRTPGLPIDHYP